MSETIKSDNSKVNADLLAENAKLREALENMINRTKNFGMKGFPSVAHFEAFCDAWQQAKAALAAKEA